jgi:hypothetical protein
VLLGWDLTDPFEDTVDDVLILPDWGRRRSRAGLRGGRAAPRKLADWDGVQPARRAVEVDFVGPACEA